MSFALEGQGQTVTIKQKKKEALDSNLVYTNQREKEKKHRTIT